MKQPKHCKRCERCQKVMAAQSKNKYCQKCLERQQQIKKGRLLEHAYHCTWYYKTFVKPEQDKLELWRQIS